MTNLPVPPEGSDFPPRLFVVDPEGCSCTDCTIGASTPKDQLTVDQVLFAMRLGRIPLIRY